MNIAIIGSGYVGLVSGTCLANLGNNVTCIDIDEEKINNLKQNKVPIYEPGLPEMVEQNAKEGRLTFTTSLQEGMDQAEIIFIAVGTPPGGDGKADLSFVQKVAEDIGKNLKDYKVIVNKSTVPVGTGAKVKEIIKSNSNNIEFDVVSNPEFLREGKAVHDFLNPDRVIISADSDKAKALLEKLYKPLEKPDKPLVFTDIPTAEIIKYASNAFLATKISFMNQLANFTEKVGADVKKVAEGMGLDPRIGPRFLQAGLGYGGSCLPKDVKALIQTMNENHCKADLLEAVEAINQQQRQTIINKIKEAVGDLKDKKIAIWGLSFKPDTDDMREAPSITIIEALQKEGATISAFDPVATEEAKKALKDIEYGENSYDILKDADALLLVTEWDEFREPDFEKIKSLMKKPTLIDGRNIYDPEEIKKLGFTYVSVGR